MSCQVVPERIPYHEGYRLRFCPPSARELLKPELVPPQASELPPGTGPTQRTRRVAQGWCMNLGSRSGEGMTKSMTD